MRSYANCSEMVLILPTVLYSTRLALLLKGYYSRAKLLTMKFQVGVWPAAPCTSNLRNKCNNNCHELALKPHRGYI